MLNIHSLGQCVGILTHIHTRDRVDRYAMIVYSRHLANRLAPPS